MSRSRRGISYVLGESNDDENHILPINAIQYSGRTSRFYTGGRDGTVKEWSDVATERGGGSGPVAENGPSGPAPPARQPQAQHQPFQPQNLPHTNPFHTPPTQPELHDELPERLLKLETALSRPLAYTASTHHYAISHSHNIHFDWINDLVLVNQDSHLVSCSSDLSLKLIHVDRPHEVTKFANIHTDYVKKLAVMESTHTLLSGGYDGKIALWDMHTLAPVLQIDTVPPSQSLLSSIYSLAASSANVFCSGGPSKVVNVHDTRMAPHTSAVRRLLGHQDNVRCLLMNDTQILSGSSDCTVKLWDLRMFKVHKNFGIHDDPVWAMCGGGGGGSGFSEFYSADSAGNVLKTDLTFLSANIGDSVPTQKTFSAGENAAVDEKIGVTTIVAKTGSPVLALCEEAVADSQRSLLVSTSGSLARYHTPHTNQLAEYQYLKTCVDLLYNRHDDAADELVAEDTNDINSDFYDIVSHLSVDTNNLDIQSSPSLNLRLPSSDPPAKDSGDRYSTMFVDQSGGLSGEFVSRKEEKEPAGGPAGGTPADCSAFVDRSVVELPLGPVLPERLHGIAFNKKPFGEYTITPKSIVAKRLFNNKRQMVVLYLNGDIRIWDLLVCRQVKNFPFSGGSANAVMAKAVFEQRQRAMDDVFDDHDTMDTLNNWCEVEIKSGKLLVTLKETSFFHTEIYYDELVLAYPHLAYDHEESNNCGVTASGDDRFQIARILLNSLFHRYAMYEWNFDRKLREELRHRKPEEIGSGCGDSSSTAANGNGASKRVKMFRRISAKTVPKTGSTPAASSANSLASSDEFEADPAMAQFMAVNEDTGDTADAQRNSYSYESSIMRLLQLNKRKYAEKLRVQPRARVDTILSLYANDPQFRSTHTKSRSDKGDVPEHYRPQINAARLPANLLIIVFDHLPDLGNLRDVLSFHYSDVQLLDFEHDNDAQRALVHDLRTQLPRWIGQPILYDKFPPPDAAKVSFQLLETDYSNLDPLLSIGGKSQKKIKKLPVMESLIKLTAHEMLRVGKILSYLTDKFESRTAEMKDHKPASDWLAIECRGRELPAGMTLQTIKAKIWKSSADIELVFRRKYDT